MKFFIDLLKEAIENAGYQVYPYSGRMMFGKQCLAFSTNESPSAATAKIIVGIEDSELRHQIGDVMVSALTDNLGKGTVIYLPRYEV